MTFENRDGLKSSIRRLETDRAPLASGVWGNAPIARATRIRDRGGVHSSAIAFVAALALWAGACGGKKESAPSATGPAREIAEATSGSGTAHSNLWAVNPHDSVQAQEAARLAAIAAMRRGVPAPPPGIKLRGGEAATSEVLRAYNQELLRVRIQQRQSPESLEELVGKWIHRWRLLPPLPTPPPGKRIVYDDVNCIVRLDPP